MKLLHHTSTRPSPFMGLWLFVWSKTSEDARRMCVLASLYASLTGCDDDQALLDNLNKELNLSRDTNALKFPAVMSRWLWKNVLPISRVDLSNEDRYVSRLVKKTPCWLCYADQETRHADISRVVAFSTRNTLQAA